LIPLAGPAGVGAADDYTAALSHPLRAALQGRSSRDVHPVWVFFQDKGPQPAQRLDEAKARLTPRALSRRARRGRAGVGFEDLPLATEYMKDVLRLGVRLRHRSRWLNAVSVEADASQVRELARLGFVSRLDLVRRERRRPEPVRSLAQPSEPVPVQPAGLFALDYGDSFGQLDQIQVPELHRLGVNGRGVVIAVFDSGFDNLGHEALAPVEILARHDFVNGDEDVGDGDDRGEGSHGTNTLSVIGGYRPGEMIGPAYAASFLLAKTEDTESETRAEEDNWAAAAEWAEALGADIISSSLTYVAFDDGETSYSPEDMNGVTAISTLAAERAAALGVVVVASAGNAGPNPDRGTIGAPADGRHVLAVGAVGPEGQRTRFSSVGPTADGRIKPDVAARGRLVKVAGSSGTSAYRRANGTSFSCPLAAGAAALVLQAHPEYTVDQVLLALRSTASQASAPDVLLGWGIVRTFEAVILPLSLPQP
jgi:subtilisin family serine protease